VENYETTLYELENYPDYFTPVYRYIWNSFVDFISEHSDTIEEFVSNWYVQQAFKDFFNTWEVKQYFYKV